MIDFYYLDTHAKAVGLLGFIPMFLSEHDERSVKEQFDANYAHGGGWRPLPKWEMDPETSIITYPGDTPLSPVAIAKLRDETVFCYPYSWVAIVQADGSYEVARID